MCTKMALELTWDSPQKRLQPSTCDEDVHILLHIFFQTERRLWYH